jgi:hypothetical protein
MRPSCCNLALLAVLCLAPALPVAAQSLDAGPEIEIALGSLQNDGQVPALAVGPDGGFLSSWLEAGGLNVRAMGSTGAPLALTRRLSPPAARPSVARLTALGPDRYVAVWAQGTLRGQILDAAGAPVGPQLVLAAGGLDFSVAAEASGGFVVAWMGTEPSTLYNYNISVRHFDAQGAPASGILLATNAGLSPSIAALPGGGFAVAWFHGEPGNPSAHYGIRARAFRADGTPAGPETVFPEPAGANSTAVRVAADSLGRWVVAWADFPNARYSSQVMAWRFSSSGEPVGLPALVAEPAEGGRIASVSSVAMRPDGSFLVAWGESSAMVTSGPPAAFPFDTLPVGGDVRARAFDAAGVALGPDFLVHPSEVGEQHEGEAAATADGWIVSWKLRLDAQAGVYARRFSLTCGTGGELCLNGGRFRAEVTWRVPATGAGGEAQPISLTGDTGAFWFFNPANYELIVKVLDGNWVNRHFWVFYGALTDVEFDLTVTDTVTGLQRTYHNPAGTMASRADTQAFPQ